jgi:hypothetical protein
MQGEDGIQGGLPIPAGISEERADIRQRFPHNLGRLPKESLRL